MTAVHKIKCIVESVQDHGDHVYSVLLRPERRVPRFKAGQFMHLALDPYDPTSFWPESRVFSIASSPAQRRKLILSYSVKGDYTRRMEHELEEGREVWVKLPYGEFTVSFDEPTVVFAGGTGIAPFVSFLGDVEVVKTLSNNLRVVYGARSTRLLVYRNLLLEALRLNPRVAVDLFVEEGPFNDTSWFTETEGMKTRVSVQEGRIDVSRMWSSLSQPMNNVYYLSGPPEMISAVGADLRGRGVPDERIRIDAWD
jgi:ferredoxin-NADP reductase